MAATTTPRLTLLFLVHNITQVFCFLFKSNVKRTPDTCQKNTVNTIVHLHQIGYYYFQPPDLMSRARFGHLEVVTNLVTKLNFIHLVK